VDNLESTSSQLSERVETDAPNRDRASGQRRDTLAVWHQLPLCCDARPRVLLEPKRGRAGSCFVLSSGTTECEWVYESKRSILKVDVACYCYCLLLLFVCCCASSVVVVVLLCEQAQRAGSVPRRRCCCCCCRQKVGLLWSNQTCKMESRTKLGEMINVSSPHVYTADGSSQCSDLTPHRARMPK